MAEAGLTPVRGRDHRNLGHLAAGSRRRPDRGHRKRPYRPDKAVEFLLRHARIRRKDGNTFGRVQRRAASDPDHKVTALPDRHFRCLHAVCQQRILSDPVKKHIAGPARIQRVRDIGECAAGSGGMPAGHKQCLFPKLFEFIPVLFYTAGSGQKPYRHIMVHILFHVFRFTPVLYRKEIR